MANTRNRWMITVRYRATGSSGPLTGTNTGRDRNATAKVAASSTANTSATSTNCTIRVSTIVLNTLRKPTSPNHSQLT